LQVEKLKCSLLVSGCKSGYGSSKLPPGVTRHVFPKNPDMRQKWIKAIPQKDLQPTPHSVICSIHFCETDFKTGTCATELFCTFLRLRSDIISKNL